MGIDILDSFSFSKTMRMDFIPHAAAYPIEVVENSIILADDFEKNSHHWSEIWSREKEKVTAEYFRQGVDGSRCVVIKSQSPKDWAFQSKGLISVTPGDVFSYVGDMRVWGEAQASINVILFDADKRVLNWSYASSKSLKDYNWHKVNNKFIIPQNGAYIKFRLSGSGIGEVFADNIYFSRETSLLSDFPKNIYVLENDVLSCQFDMSSYIFSVKDKRIDHVWTTVLQGSFVTAMQQEPECLKFEFIDNESFFSYVARISFGECGSEIICEVNADAEAAMQSFVFPPIFNIVDGSLVVAPIFEGLLLPYNKLEKLFYDLRYKGGWPNPFIGVLQNNAGWMEIVETPVDFVLGIRGGIKNKWISEKGRFGYARKIRFCFFDKADYVAMAKRYREYAMEKGYVKTFSEKAAERKNDINKLAGAVNVWYWGNQHELFISELKKKGIARVLYSNARDVKTVAVANKSTFLSSVYDIYQDVWPTKFRSITSKVNGWPEDIVLDENRKPVKGWVLKQGDKEFPGGVICSKEQLKHARKKIAEELAVKSYTARFFDTTTSTPWRECYNERHPLTRMEDKNNRIELLGISSREHGLITGSEDGVDVAVPVCDYFEGMMSIGKGRLPDSGRNVSKVSYMQPTKDFIEYGVGEKYRIPLWELIFHDCAVSCWYWGDSVNRIPEYWWKKDLFNILYGNMPLWAIRNWDHWEDMKEQFIASYHQVSPVIAKVFGKEMLTHRFLTDDYNVQETTFSNNVRIVVNFGEQSQLLADVQYILPTHGFVVFENGIVWKEGVCI